MKQSRQLIEKYNVPGPRYTSYPTVPFWEADHFTAPQWQSAVSEAFTATNKAEGISLYIHLPFCESLCTFCGCNKRITKNHAVEPVYIAALLKEWKMYKALFGAPVKIQEMHLGGGTPTFFSAEHLKLLISGILEGTELVDSPSFGLEGHPNMTSAAQLKVLHALGFRRISFGIQDFDPIVQDLINRKQSFEKVAEVTELAREVGFLSVNFDIIYGLPKQTLRSIIDTMQKTSLLRPDRIAFYSYAHVPWIKGLGQRKFTESDLPKGAEKRALYDKGREMLEEMGYFEVGMDHFALPTDSLYHALREQDLHRNFMGYTESHTTLQIGLGVSAISDSWTAFAQNEKKVEDYYARLERDELPIFRGHLLTCEDLQVRHHILNLMCQMETSFKDGFLPEQDTVFENLQELFNDGLLTLGNNKLKLTERGKPFVRNVCMAFDLRLMRRQPTSKLFSMTV